MWFELNKHKTTMDTSKMGYHGSSNSTHKSILCLSTKPSYPRLLFPGPEYHNTLVPRWQERSNRSPRLDARFVSLYISLKERMTHRHSKDIIYHALTFYMRTQLLQVPIFKTRHSVLRWAGMFLYLIFRLMQLLYIQGTVEPNWHCTLN